MMRLKQFKKMADAYGADSDRWPEALRTRAEALLKHSAEARETLRHARQIDEVLTAMTAARDAQFTRVENPGAGLVRLRSGVMARIGSSARPRKRSSRWSLPNAGLGMDLWRRRWIGLTAATSLAVLGGFALGLMYSPEQPQQDFVTLLQPAPVQFLVN